MMRKRILACILAAAMTLGSLPVSAAEISHEGETENASIEFSVEEAAIEETLVEETSMKETSIEETFIEETATKETSIEETLVEETSMKETSIEETLVEETSMKETRTESEATETAAPKEEETEERPRESEAQSEEEANSTEPASEAETTGESETTQEDESMESESASEEMSSETDYEEHPNGLLPFEIGGTDIFAGLNTSLYTRGIENRAKYDPRVDAPEEMTSVKDQGQWGTCWAHGAMACLENAMIRQGLADNTIDLSERHLAYFAKHTGIDKLENANDDTIIVTPENKTVRGGSIHLAAIKLMNWHGAASEEKYPYYPDPKMWDRMVVSQSDAQDMEAMAHDIYFIPTGNASKKESITAMKKLIAEYGCVEVGYEHKGEYYNNDTFAYYDPNPGGGHAVTVVGWDDNFPIEKFGKYKPSNNGAWITKNSWGEGFGDGGYFYISYDDVSLDSGNIESVIVAADKNEYDNNYFYGNTNSYSAKWSYGKAAQVYKVKSGVNSEKLSAVSVMLYSEKAEYSIQVYKNPKLVNGVVEDPESGTAMLKEPVTGKTGYAGLYTIDLPEPVIFSKGDLMSIVFTFSGNVRVYADQSGMSESKDENGNVDSTTKWTNTTHAGQSFYKNGSTWKDAHDQEFNFRINALTQNYIYRVTFLDAKGNKISEQIVDGGKDAVPPTSPEREGYTFKGWSGNYQNISRNTKLTAKYEPTPYSITYELNGGMLETDNPSSYTIETDTISLEEPLRRGHFFAGWYEQNDFSGTSIDTIQKGSIGNKTLYAKWEEDSADSTKPVLFPQEGIIEEGETIIIRAPKDADIYYTLDGTAPTIENGIKYTGPFTISKSVTIKAVSARNEELSAVTEASYQYYALRLALAEETTDCFKMRSKKLKLTQIPTTKSESDMTWTTSNQFIVTVSKDGTITGVAVGTATIMAKTKNSKGDEVTASCRVTVKDNGDIAAGRYKNIVWYIDSAGKLMVTGTGEFLVDPSGGMGNETESETETGELADASSEKRPPWYNYCGRIRSAEIRVTDITNISRMFYNYDNLTKVDLSGFKTDQVTDMSYMFWGCNNLTEVNLSGFKTDQVIDMSYMFWGCSNLTNLDVSGFKTGRVTDMSHMFQNCSNLTNLDVSGFKTDRVTNMDSMFWGCSNLTNLDVSGFKTDQVTNMSCMFWYCTKLTNLDVSGFKTDQVTDVNSMFINCNELTELNLSSFDLSNVTEKFKANMLPYDRNSKLRTIQTPRNLKQSVSLLVKDTDYAWCKPDGTVITELPQNMSESILITQKLGGTNRDITWEIDGDGKLTVTGTGDLGYASYNRARWYKYRESVKSATVNVTGMTDASYLFYECSNLTDVDLSGFQMDQITDVTLMFSDCSSLQTIQTPCNLKLSVSLPVKGNNYAWYKPDGTTITKLPQNMSESILITQKLGGTNQNITWQIDEDGKLTVTGTGDFSTAAGTDRAPWYQHRESVKSAEVNVTGMTNASYLFYGCSNLTQVDVSGLKTDQITNVSAMFSGCDELTALDLSSFNLGNVTEPIKNMLPTGTKLQTFQTPCNLKQSVPLTAQTGYAWSKPDGTIITELPQNMSESILLTPKPYKGGIYQGITWEIDENGKLTVTGTGDFSAGTGPGRAPWYRYREEILTAEIKVTGITNTSYMFYDCTSLTEVDVSGLKTDQVTDMFCMFGICNSLTKLDVSGFKTDQVTDMSSMFFECDSLTNLDVSGFNTDQVTDMSAMFCSCDSLTNLDISGFNTDQVTDMSAMFSSCGSLTNLDVSGFKTDCATDMEGMFSSCGSLTNLNVSGFKTDQVSDMRNMFYGCGSLTNLDVSGFKTDRVTDMEGMFENCGSLTNLDVSGFKTDQVSDMRNMFYGCNELTDLNLGSFELSNADWTYRMLPNSNRSKLQTIQTPRNVKDSVELPKKTDYVWCKPDGTILTELPQNLSESILITRKPFVGGTYQNITWEIDENGKLTVTGTGEYSDSTSYNRAPWYAHRSQIASAEIKVTGMTDASYLFYGCSNLKEVNFSSFDTGMLTNMSYLFGNCGSLTSLDLSDFDMQTIAKASNMLNNCNQLSKITAPRNLNRIVWLPGGDDDIWYLPNKTTTTLLPRNLSYSVALAKNEVPDVPDTEIGGSYGNMTWRLDAEGNLTVEGTGEVTNVSGQNRAPWHDYANDIKSAKMNMTGMTDMSYLFDGCANLTSLDLSGFDAADVTNTTDILQGCTKLTTIHTPCNLKCAIALSANEDEAWYQEDGTAVTELPQNLDHSILLTKTAKSEKPTPPLEETVYKVTFDLQGHGAQIAAIEVKEGNKISEPSRPEAEGYDFTGWYKEKACKTLWNFAKDTVEADTTLYAGWKKKSSDNIGDSEDTKESDIQIVGLAKSYQYTGVKIIPAFDVIDYDITGGKLLAPGVDYTVTYRNNKEPGIATIIVKGKGNYAAVKGYEARATFAIINAQDAGETPLANIKGAKISGGLADAEYNGVPHIPQTITLTLKDKITTVSYTYNTTTEKYEKAGGEEPMDVNIAVSNNTNKGTASVLVTGVDDRGKTVKIKGKFKITPIDLSLKPVTIEHGNAVYSPKGAVPETLKVTCEGTELKPGRDYTVKYANNKTVGIGTITITGKGNYTKKAQTQYYSITAADMSDFRIAAVTANERTKAGKIKATIVDETGNALKPKQYTLEVYPATTAEDGTVTVGPERYNDTQELAAGQTIHVVAMAIDGTNLVAGTTTAADFTVGMDISKAKFTLTPAAKKGIAYTGSEIKLEEKHFASVTYQGRGALHMKKEDGTGDYEIVSYTNNVNKGTATAVIRGINAYSGTKTIKFKIAQKEIKNIKLSEMSKQILEQFSASRYLRY